MIKTFCIFFAYCWIAIPVGCQVDNRKPSRYLIPEGYVGWVRMTFNVKDAPPLSIEDGLYLFRFPPSGSLQTSSDIEYGVSSGDDYYYYCGDERRKLKLTGWDGGGLIWAGYNGWSGKNFAERKDVHEGFFVGTEEQLKGNAWNDRSEDGHSKVGSIVETKKCN